VTNPLIVKATCPAKDFTSITQTGLKALNLALTYSAEISPRLPGATDGLRKDLDALGVVLPGAVQARNEAGAATATQNATVRRGYARVQAIRQTVRKSGAPKEVQRAYGVGQATAQRQVRHVKAALQQIVDRATLVPEEATKFGLIPADVVGLNDFITSLTKVDMSQETKRVSAPLSTRARNVTANRILQTAVLIAGTGMRAFADSPPEHASFQALMANTSKSTPPKAKPAQPKAKKPAKPPQAPESPALEAPVAAEAEGPCTD
jgi:hypothetical protein